MSSGVLSAYGVDFRYLGGRQALTGASIELEKGEITAVLGPNGSGKSTLLKILAGILPLRERGGKGQVLLNGQDFLALSHADRAKAVAYVGADFQADFPLSAQEAVLLGRICRGGGLGFTQASREDADAVQAAMEECRCWGFRERLLHTLSGGERQLVAVARAFAQGARVLLLDETLSRMDLDHLAAIGAQLRKRARDGHAIALVAHDWNLATEWADSCVLIRGGETKASGPLREVVTAARISDLYPGTDLVVAPSPASGSPKVFFGAVKPL